MTFFNDVTILIPPILHNRITKLVQRYDQIVEMLYQLEEVIVGTFNQTINSFLGLHVLPLLSKNKPSIIILVDAKT